MTVKTILVTGASGRVARVLTPHLLGQGNLHLRWQSRRPGAGSGWIACDPLSDLSGLTAVCWGCDAVLHLAGVTSAATTPNFSVNARLADAVLRAAQYAGVPLLLAASSMAVYGSGGVPMTEDAPLRPLAAYGRSKVETEDLLRTAAHGGPTQLCQLRLANVAGADALLTGQPRSTVLDQFADGTTPVRSYIGPASLARVVSRLVELGPHWLPETLNVAAPAPVEMADLMRAADLPWTPRPARADLPRQVVVCTRRLEGLVPLNPLEATPEYLVSELNIASQKRVSA